MNRALRRALAREESRAIPLPRRPKANPDAVRLRSMPWKVSEVFAPVEAVISRIERDGTVDACKGKPVFLEPGRGGWYEMAPAIDGITSFHQLAAKRLGIALDTTGLEKLARKLDYGTPLEAADLARARETIDTLKRFALNHLTLGQAKEVLRDSQIAWKLEKITEKAA